MNSFKSEIGTRRRILLANGIAIALAMSIVSTTPTAQSVNSGSDGSDGALTITPGGSAFFDPFDVARWGRVLDADGDGVYNFTTISIGSSIIIRGDTVNRPIYWLATGPVNITATANITLRGLPNDVGGSDLVVRRAVGIPGPGGYAGGAGGNRDGVPTTPGEGPGGGFGEVACNFSTIAACGKGGLFTANRFLVPLVGGSGGGGSIRSLGFGMGTSGGAGGGAILIASSVSITMNGLIDVSGANGNPAGGGSGGSIRLVAPRISGLGTFNVVGGTGATGVAVSQGSPGLVRLEAYDIPPTSYLWTPSSTMVLAWPGHPSTLRPASSVRVTAVDGIPIPADPRGSFQVPDLAIGKGTPVNVEIEAHGMPPGTVVTLQMYPQTLADPRQFTVNLTAQGTLTGTFESSSATIPFAFPFGVSRGFVRANW